MANSNRSNNPGNFANDHERAVQAGQKGGQASSGNQRDSGSNSSRNASSGNSGNFANDRERASEAGRKGGENSHSGGRNRNDND